MAFPVPSPSSTHSRATILRGCAVVLLLCPLLARADEAQAGRLREVGRMAKFVPDVASSRLRTMEWEMAGAPAPLRTDFLYYYSTAERGIGDLTRALDLADQLISFGRRNHDNVALA